MKGEKGEKGEVLEAVVVWRSRSPRVLLARDAGTAGSLVFLFLPSYFS